MRKALVIGCSGQDGTYLTRLLEEKGYAVVGIDQMEPFNTVDITSPSAVIAIMQQLKPEEIYYLAAFHHSAEDPAINDHNVIARSFEVNTLSLNNFLHAITQTSPKSRLFYAASSLVFGNSKTVPQTEATPMEPAGAYGISKAAGAHLCRYYREEREIFGSVGILYNHESPLRPAQFITRKVARAAVNVKKGVQDKVVVGDLNALVDWGYAPDYVAAMWAILQLEKPDDFIVASGTVHSVRELVQTAFEALGMSWENHVVQDMSLLKRKRPTADLQGDARKLTRLTGWYPKVSFQEMVRELVAAELSVSMRNT